jgi:hypothetical protein
MISRPWASVVSLLLTRQDENDTVVTGMFREFTVVVSPVKQIACVYRKPKPNFALKRIDHTQAQAAIAPPLEHSHALDVLNGLRTQSIHQKARQIVSTLRMHEKISAS